MNEEEIKLERRVNKAAVGLGILTVATIYSSIIKYGQHSNSARFYRIETCFREPECFLDNLGTFSNLVQNSLVDGIELGIYTGLALTTGYYTFKGIKSLYNKITANKESSQQQSL